MAQTCKHGTREDWQHCIDCAKEAGEKLIERIEAAEKNVNCQWCGETIGNALRPWAFEEEHITCEIAYQRGQQWAIEKLKELPWLMSESPSEWLADQTKETI